MTKLQITTSHITRVHWGELGHDGENWDCASSTRYLCPNSPRQTQHSSVVNKVRLPIKYSIISLLNTNQKYNATYQVSAASEAQLQI